MAIIQNTSDRELKKYYFLIFFLLTLLLLSVPSVSAQKIAVDISHNQGKEALDDLERVIKELGYDFVEIEEFNESILDDVDGLIIDAGSNLRDEELEVLFNWFKKGGKMLWVSGTSDANQSKIIFANKILTRVDSRLRLEPLTLIEYSPYSEPLYVIADVVNDELDISNNIERVLFYYSTIVCGYDNIFGFIPVKTYLALENASTKNIFWVLKSGEGGILTTLNGSSIPFAHEVYKCPLGELPLHSPCICGKEPWKFEEEAMKSREGYVVMAVETFAGPSADNKIIVTASAVYSYRSIISDSYKTSLRNITLDGKELVKNSLMWGLKIEKSEENEKLPPIVCLILLSLFLVALFGVKRLKGGKVEGKEIEVASKPIKKDLFYIGILTLFLYLVLYLLLGVELSHYVWAPSFYEAAIINFILGLTTGVTCVTFCGLILIPHIAHKFYVSAAVKASLIFSVSRLFPYLVLTVLAFYLGSFIVQSQLYIGIVRTFMSVVIVLYGSWIRFNWPRLQFQIKIKHKYGSTFLLGLVAGFATICPTLWVAIVYAALMKTLLLSIVVILSFWSGTTIWIILIGFLTIKLKENVIKTAEAFEKFRKGCGIFLISLGITFILLSLTAL
ncbi:hypothetical protein DRP07_02945 [Archaeoglobales archaeon]|nr:MAG: hypothetical protein DRP07_02945 [Archaeoglobales archaeon]